MEKKPKSLEEWQVMLTRIYSLRNKKFYGPADLLLHIFEETAKIDEAFRKEGNSEIPLLVAHFFGWFLAFTTNQKMILVQVVFEKYQGICPYCGKKKNCMCISEGKKPKQWFRNPKAKIPPSLNDWQEMFKQIYGRVNKVAGRDKVWLHVHEELGELSQAFRLGKIEIREEIADVFAWLIAFCNQLGINLAEITYQLYPGKCSVCGETICKCLKE